MADAGPSVQHSSRCLTMRKRPETKYQNPSRQVTVKAKDRLRIIKMDAEEKA